MSPSVMDSNYCLSTRLNVRGVLDGARCILDSWQVWTDITRPATSPAHAGEERNAWRMVLGLRPGMSLHSADMDVNAFGWMEPSMIAVYIFMWFGVGWMAIIRVYLLRRMLRY